MITDASLHLELATPSGDLDRRIGAVVSTESISPAAYLEPDTLILTTGMALNFEDARIWGAYVERLVLARVVALAFGVGAPHAKVPDGLRKAAREHGLPILVVPSDVPFLRLQQTVGQAIAEERFALTRRAWEIARACTRLAATDVGAEQLLNLISGESELALSIVDEEGAVFMAAGGRAAEPGHEPLEIPLPIGEETAWQLSARVTSAAETRILLSPAASVVGMVLTRMLGAEAPGSTRVLAEAVREPGGEEEALPRALMAAGFSANDGVRVLRVAARSPLRRHLLTRRIEAMLPGHRRVVDLPGCTLIFQGAAAQVFQGAATQAPGAAPESTGPGASARIPGIPREIEFRAVLSPPAGDGLLVSEPSGSVAQLALTSRLVISRPPPRGVTYGVAPDLADVSRMIPPGLRHATVDALLGPLMAAPDARRLAEALAALLDTPSLTAAAARLGVHRNTAQTLKLRVERTLGVGLDDGAQRTLLGLALALRSETPGARVEGTPTFDEGRL